jgi:hypothetical protein
MWGVPIDHEYFKTTNNAQWLWYFYNSIEDKKESFLNSRSLLEYHVGFLEPALVNKIRNERDNAQNTKEGVIGTTNEAAFAASVGSMFGSDLNIPFKDKKELSEEEVHHFTDVADRIKEYEEKQAELKTNTVPYNYKHWTEFDLG